MYNGHKSYITDLGKFCAIFELEIKNRITGDQQFALTYPETYTKFKAFKNNLGHAKTNDINDVINRRKGITLAYSGSNSLAYELCRHIRNSVCHMLPSVERDKILINDKYRGRISCKGSINKRLFLDFIRSLIREYEQH